MDREQFDRVHGVRTDGKVHLRPVNVDAMNSAELKIAADHPALHAEVKRYATMIIEARHYRLAGDIDKAFRCEAKAQSVYNDFIPRKLRW